MMVLGRESKGYSQTHLASILDVKQGTISKYENGILEPPEDFVNILATCLGFEPEFFFQTSQLHGMSPFHYRKRQRLSAKKLAKINAEINLRRSHLQIMLRSYDSPSSELIPTLDRDEYRSNYGKDFSIEDSARQLREMWMLPDGPVENVIDLLEKNGGIVIPCDFGTSLFDAVSQKIEGLPALFFVNVNAPTDRIRYTLCHELGHMVLHTTSSFYNDDDIEKEADLFAAAFLLPPNSFKNQLAKFDFRQIANLKRYWKVSMASIAMRAHDLELITPYQKKNFFMQISKLGYRTAEPHEPQREIPKKLNQLIDYFLFNLGYSKEELAKTLMISSKKFEELYAPTRPELPSSSPSLQRPPPFLRIVK